MKTGDVIKVLRYRDNLNPTIKYGEVVDIRDTHYDTGNLKTYKTNVITRSQNLITLKSNGVFRTYYDKFLTQMPVSRLTRLWLKFKGVI